MDGKNPRIYTDKQGLVLDSYARAVRLHQLINQEINDHTFYLSKYTRSEQENFWDKTLLDQFLEYKLEKIRPSWKSDFKNYIKTAKEYWGPLIFGILRRLEGTRN